MPSTAPSSSSWNLPKFSAEEMDAALSTFQARELMELSSSHLPIFEVPDMGADSFSDPGLDLDGDSTGGGAPA